jgi:DNA-binding MarR family transcriptional regulator
MTPEHEVDLPMEFTDKAHEALVSVWWTGVLLRRASRGFFKSSLSSEAEFNLLMSLKYSSKPLTQNDLSRRLLVDKANVTVLVDRMERAGLIKRNEVASDRRRYHITLTAQGRKTIDAIDREYFKKVKQVMGCLTAREHAELIGLTRKLREGLAQSEEKT